MAAGEGKQCRPFSDPVFSEVAAMWRDWQRGIPPSREFKGRGGQSPRLLAAFAALDRAQYAVEHYFHEKAKREARKR